MFAVVYIDPMKNVTIRTKTGREIGFWKDSPSRQSAIEEKLREDFGPGVYKVCYKTTKNVGSGNDARRVSRPVADIYYVEGANGENPVTGKQGAAPMSGTSDELLRHLISQNIEAVKALDSTLSVLVDDVESMKEILREFSDEGEEPDDSDTQESPSDVGFMQKIMEIAQRPEYAGFAADLMSTQDQGALEAKVGDFITKNPMQAVGLVMEFFKK